MPSITKNGMSCPTWSDHQPCGSRLAPRLKLNTYDTLLVATDGVFDNLQLDEIVQLVRKGPLPAQTESLRQLAWERMTAETPNTPSKPDDCSAITFRLSRLAGTIKDEG